MRFSLAVEGSVRVEHWRQFLGLRYEPDRERVNAVTSVLVSEAFAFKDVAQVTAAVSAEYLRATPVLIETALYAFWIFFIEAGPAAARIEFGLRRKERVVAAPANKSSRRR